MKRYIKLSLLLLLIPLFAQNVYAKDIQDDKTPQVEIIDKVEENELNTLEDEILEEYEFDEENDKLEESNIDNIETKEEISDNVSNDDIKTGASLEEILASIDSLYDIDLNETDNFTSKVKELLRNIIDEKLNENNYDLESLGYNYELIWNYLENDKVDSYTLIISDKNNNKVNKELSIKYLNSLNRNESDSNKIEEFVNNNDLNLNKEYTLDEVLSNNTININTYLTNIFENTGINFFITNYTNNKNYLLSNTSFEKVILSINEIIYKTIDIENKYTTIVEVPIEEDKSSFIENTIKDKLIEYELITNETIKYNLEENEIHLINSASEILLGNIIIREIKKDYIITTGANSTVNETENLRIGIVSDLNEFKRIEVNNVELNPNYYSINNNEIVINNEFIKSLNKGTYNLEVIYKTGRAKTTFNLISKATNTPSLVQKPIVRPSYSYRPNYTGNNGNKNNNSYVSSDDEEDKTNIDTEEEQEEKDDEEEKIDNDKEIDLGAILEDNKDNDYIDDSKDKVKDDNNKTGILATIKSSVVPIIIVIVVILIGGVTMYVFFKAKEEHIL